MLLHPISSTSSQQWVRLATKNTTDSSYSISITGINQRHLTLARALRTRIHAPPTVHAQSKQRTPLLPALPPPRHARHHRPYYRPTLTTRSPSLSHAGALSEHDLGPDPTTLLALRESIPIGQRALPNLRFARVLTGDTYFLSLYAALAQLRSALAVGLAVGAGAGTGGGPAPRAFPHLSLFYVADEEAHVRARLLQEMEEGVVRDSEDGLSVALRRGGGAGTGDEKEGSVLDGFTGMQIWIVDCDGPVEGWEVLDKILLATSDR